MTGILPVSLYLLAFLGYGLFAILLVMRSMRPPLSLLMAFAATLTATWAILGLGSSYNLAPNWCVSIMSVMKDGAWLAVILAMMDRPSRSMTTWRLLVGISASVVLLHVVLLTSNTTLGSVAGVRIDSRLLSLLTTILGCVLIENLVRNSSRDRFWTIKYLVIGMVAILTFQFFIETTEFLIRSSDGALMIASPFFYLVALPLFVLTAIRSPTAKLQVHSSRQVVFHTASLVIAGVVFQGTAITAYYLRNYGGDTGTVLSIMLAFLALVSALGVATSGTLRSQLRHFINENFFNYKYDYRQEWTKFIRALSAVEESGIPLKVLRTFADLLDSTGGALWVWKGNFGQYLPMAKWSVRTDLKPIASDDPILAAFKDEHSILIDLTSPDQPMGAAFWREQFPDGWLLVPLRYRSQLVAIILISKSRTQRALNWEDRNLIALVALQLAASLAHDETSQALLDAKQMEEFNKRFAFVIHDMKNTIGQLDLLARNAERFSEDPMFQKDMTVTLCNSVNKLNALLVQLRASDAPHDENSARAKNQVIDVVALVKAFVSEKQGFGLPVSMNDNVSPACATIADDRTLLNVLEHVFANAIEVTPTNAEVNLELSAKRGAIRIAINDHGPGMSEEFINERLFRPFRTTKQHGFGIGAYQARENVRKLGGNFEVFSIEGHGTSIVISVPCNISASASMN